METGVLIWLRTNMIAEVVCFPLSQFIYLPLALMPTSDLTALTELCAREPIHIPGAIQPHGVLLCVDVPALQIRNVSGNANQIFGVRPETLVGRSLAAFMSVDEAEALRAYVAQPDLKEAAPHTVVFVDAAGDMHGWTVHAHATDGICILELEIEGERSMVARLLSKLQQQVRVAVRSVQSTTSQQQLVSVTAEQVRAITGFDRVMIYQFTEDWHGHVVAESREPAMHSYLHHYFPASDIPPQARAIFLNNWLRTIPDASYEPVAIIPQTNFLDGTPLNLGQSYLRSVSPIHIEYLRNMGVAATLTMPLISEGKLWGLVACHHSTPRQIGVDQRLAAVLVAQLVSSQLIVKAAMEDQRYRAQLAATHRHLLELMEREDDLVDGLVKYAPTLLDIAGASGAAAAVYIDHAWTVIGNTPTIEEIEALVDWLIAEHEESAVFATDCLGREFAPAKAYKAQASGLAALSIPKSPRNFILWFRPEVSASVTWAGQPSKMVELDADVWRLHPRFSFDSWVEKVEGTAAPWKKVELEAILELRNSILALDLQRAFAKEQAARAMAERLNEERQSMVHVVSHDIRTPLAVIKMSLQMLGMRADLGAEQYEKLIARSQRSAESIERLVTSVLDVARMETENEPSASDVEVCGALHDIADLLRPLAERDGISLTLECQAPAVHVHFALPQFEQVIGNLVSNALKFTPRGGEIYILAETDQKTVTISVRDTGTGISAELLPHVFKRFVRGAHHNGEGAGLGLAIVKETVERFGGRVTTRGADPTGTVMALHLPAI